MLKEALDSVSVTPFVYKAPLCETVSRRPYWCILSAWSVPILAFYNSRDDGTQAIVHKYVHVYSTCEIFVVVLTNTLRRVH